MQDRPTIATAIPRARYQIGDYSATLLGAIDSPDARQYQFIMAFVPDGQREPKLYVCSERAQDPARPGACNLRLVSDALSDLVDQDERWAELEAFSEQALALGCQALGLQVQQAIKLM